MQLQSEKGWERWVDDAFSKLDINGDGFISMEEILDKLPLETTDPDDDMESERFLQVSIHSHSRTFAQVSEGSGTKVLSPGRALDETGAGFWLYLIATAVFCTIPLAEGLLLHAFLQVLTNCCSMHSISCLHESDI